MGNNGSRTPLVNIERRELYSILTTDWKKFKKKIVFLKIFEITKAIVHLSCFHPQYSNGLHSPSISSILFILLEWKYQNTNFGWSMSLESTKEWAADSY